MSILKQHTLSADADMPVIDGFLATVTPASDDDALHIISLDPTQEDTRSNFVWVRLQNGDLMLATFPQGDTYEMIVTKLEV